MSAVCVLLCTALPVVIEDDVFAGFAHQAVSVGHLGGIELKLIW